MPSPNFNYWKVKKQTLFSDTDVGEEGPVVLLTPGLEPKASTSEKANKDEHQMMCTEALINQQEE